MDYVVLTDRMLFQRSPMLYGHFLEHFHRQIYGGVFMPGHPLSDENGFRNDVLQVLKHIRTPIIRWPGGCYVSSYHWENGVGKNRVPAFDKAWRVEDSNTFGTDEFIKLCRAIGCEPYICTNAGTGTEEEMSNWMEYCNLPTEGQYAKQRIANGYEKPHHVKYWSIGNENYGHWEIGAKDAQNWGCFVREAAKMMKHVDPDAFLSAAALSDVHWNTELLDKAGKYLDWISIHGYWDFMQEEHNPAGYEACMAYTAHLSAPIDRVRGLLTAYGLESKIKIAYDEWNLRSWHHPRVFTYPLGKEPKEYLTPRDKNDLNETYTMADAVFAGCFLNTMLRNADLVGMANFAPIVNTRGAIFTYDKGIVLRPTYHVFDMYANLMGDEVLDSYTNNTKTWQVTNKEGRPVTVDMLDFVATRDTNTGGYALSVINKHDTMMQTVNLKMDVHGRDIRVITLCGRSADDYNDIGREYVKPYENNEAVSARKDESISFILPPHSINIIQIK